MGRHRGMETMQAASRITIVFSTHRLIADSFASIHSSSILNHSTMRSIFGLLLGLTCITHASVGQDHHHEHHADASPIQPAPPKVFLDKSPKIVEYQLKRLDNQRLLLVERKTDDAKYIPVYAAILARVGMSPQYRDESLRALRELQQRDAVSILLESISKLDPEDRDQARTAEQLAQMLLSQPAADLQDSADAILEATEAENPFLRAVAFAALVTADRAEQAVAQSGRSDASRLAFLNSIELIAGTEQRNQLRSQVVAALETSKDDQILRAAIRSIGFIPQDQAASFELLAPRFSEPALRTATVRSLLRIPADQRSGETSAALARALVDQAEQTPAEQRTSSDFIDAMQLADQLLAKLPSDEAKSLRQRLDAVTVRVIRIRTVEEEMRYDVPYFAVQAGKTIQIVLENHDLMPHNLVITTPGALKEVAQLGLQAGPDGGWKGLAYVPESDQVLHATNLVPADQQATLTFDAPVEPGEYPYVCTFPQHWYRMYGVMVVVEDLDAWLKNPTEPANPIGSNRSFVQAWTLNDLKDELDAGLRGRTPEIGKRIFQEASCAGCHRVAGEGGIIGPDLTEVVSRWKGDRVGILREILEPSHKVDEKYLMQKILTVDGQTITGIRVAEDDEKLTLVSSPDAKEPIVLLKDDIEAMVPSSVSMMPKALLDQYTRDEIFELLAYLESVQNEAK